jgi:nitrite reductase (NO-forming)
MTEHRPTAPARASGPRPLPGQEGSAVPRAGAAAVGVVLAVVVALAALLVRPALAEAPGSGGSTAAPTAAAAAAAPTPTGHTTHVTLQVDGMAFTPSTIAVPRGDRLRVTLHNTGDQRHDLLFANGTQIGLLAPDATGTVEVGVVGADLEGWCTLPGQRQSGMVVHVKVEGDGMPGMDMGSTGPGGDAATSGGPTMAELERQAAVSKPVPAGLPPLDGSTEHRYTFTVTEQKDDVAPGRTRTTWTYNGTSPGPVLHGKVGDTFHITLVNRGTMGHSIDFHAGEVAPDQPMRTIEPGQRLEYTFTARRAGAWLYHCSTMPMSNHIANGMFGAVVIEPDGLDRVDRSYVLVQSELYLGRDGEPADAAKVAAMEPDVVAFNGRAFQYDAHPLTAKAGERVRFWVVDTGPNLALPFHVVGAQFDTVWSEGAYSVRRGADVGAQVLPLLAAQGGFVELVPREAGRYPFVNHAMSLGERGAHGVLEVTD